MKKSDTFAARLLAARKAAGLSQKGLARESGVSRFGIRQYENGETDNPTIKTVRALAKALGVNLSDLIAD